MKEAMGSSVLFYIILMFLAIFIIFSAFIIEYALAYRASNYVITKIEKNEGIVDVGNTNSVAGDGSLIGELRALNYHGDFQICCNNLEKDNKVVGAVYKIETKVNFNMPLFNMDIYLPIRNETKTIHGISCSQYNVGIEICK